MNFIDMSRKNGFKAPLSMKMLKYYTDLGFPCWCIGTIGSNLFLKFIYVFNPDVKLLDFKDLRYIASLDCNPKIPFGKIDKYLCKKYGQI